jgi:hypothetical protein
LPTIRNQKVRKGLDPVANYQQPLQAAGGCLGRAASRDPAIDTATHRQKGHLQEVWQSGGGFDLRRLGRTSAPLGRLLSAGPSQKDKDGDQGPPSF